MSHPFVTVTASEAERRLDDVVASLTEHGAAVILDAVDPSSCDRLHAAMMAELDRAVATPPALGVPGHVQHNPPPRGDCMDPEIFANPVALSVARAVLGRGVHLALYTGNTLLGRTEAAQPVHWDEPQLWPSGRSGSVAAPAHSLTVNIPLVDVTVENGALELWPGTHLDVRSGDRVGDDLLVPLEWLADAPPSVRVPVPKGGLLLRDGRVWHRGTTNVTDHPRAMVAMVYAAWWFRALPIDFYPDAAPVLEASGIRVSARYREEFDHLVWPPDWEIVPRPV